MGDWREQLAEIVKDCATKGWDSYAADPVGQKAADAAEALLDSLWLVPTIRGGVCVTFATEGLNVEFDADGSVGEVWLSTRDLNDYVRKAVGRVR